MIRCVLFDLDGVLCDLREVHYAALNFALVSHGYEGIDRKAHVCTFNGLPTKEKLRILVDQGKMKSADIESISAMKQQETIRKAETVPFDPDTYCLMSGLWRKGIELGVVSNAVRPTVEACLKTLRIFGAIHAVVCNEDGPHKPSPALYQIAMKRLDQSPSRCLAVEDSPYGVEAAEKSGCTVQVVSSPKDLTPRLIWKHLS